MSQHVHRRLAAAREKYAQDDMAGAGSVLRRILRRDPEQCDALYMLADVLQRSGNLEEAARCSERLGLLIGETGQLTEAADAFQRAVDASPTYGSAWHNLAVVRVLQAQPHNAEACFRKALELRPTALSWNSLGRLMETGDRLYEALDCFERAIALAPDNAEAYANRGAAMHSMGRFEEAERSFRQALSLQHDHQPALTGLGVLLDLQGKYEQGLDLLLPHVVAGNNTTEIALAYGRLLRRVGRHQEAIAVFGREMDKPGLTEIQRRWLHFGLGELHDDDGCFDTAFKHFAAGNTLCPDKFSAEDYEGFVGRSVAILHAKCLASLPRIPEVEPVPVFIVGMPRSGTTLVEQICAAHPAVHAGGERNDILNAAKTKLAYTISGDAFPDSLLRLGAEDLQPISDAYRSASAIGEEVLRVTDKMPPNFKFLAFIQLLFPNALIIHCRRHPLDCALSCYFHDFSGQEFSFSNRLENIAVYLRGYETLMTHWSDALSLSMLDVHYEELVNDQEAVTRSIIAFLGLPWDPACLEFHRQSRLVNTASHAQVRQPLYKRAVGRHRNYLPHLKALETLLDPGTESVREI